jgi:hypothetical protein
MSKFKELKNYVKEHIPQVMGIAAGIIVVLLIGAIVILSISGDEEDKSKVTSAEKSASENITSEKNTTQKSTTKKTPETTIENETSDEETTDGEKTDKETTTKESTTKSSQVIQYTTSRVLETTKSQHTTVQPTTKKQEQTTKKPEKPTTPPRGKNGVILEELSFVRRQGTTNVPKTYTEAKENVTVPGSIPGYTILYTSPNLVQNNIFNNEITFKETTESQVVSIYGQPLTKYDYKSGGGKELVYQYGYYANGNSYEIIYIGFGFFNRNNKLLSSIAIGNAEDLGIEEYLK